MDPELLEKAIIDRKAKTGKTVLEIYKVARVLGYITEGDVETVRPQNNHVAVLLSLLKRSYEEQ